MTALRFLPLLALCLAAAPAATVQDCLASPADCGLPPLRFHESPTAPEPSAEHDWQMPDKSMLGARLLHIVDYGRKQACAVLLTPQGRKELLMFEDMQPADRQFAEDWVKARGFIELPLCPTGSVFARVMELVEPRPHFLFPHLEIQLMTPDGRLHLYCCNAGAMSPGEVARHAHTSLQGRDCVFFTEEGLARLREAGAAPKDESAAPPVLMAASPAEARAFADLHGLEVVTLYLNRRGSEIDLAWKRYLSLHPEAGAYWNNRYVFVGIHCDGQGNYPAELLQEIRATVRYGTADRTPPAALFTGSADKGVPRFYSSPMPNGCYSIADFLKTPPSKISF